MVINYSFTMGELIKAIRLSNNLTQIEFSHESNVAQSTISKIEQDTFDDISFKLVSLIGQKYKIPLHNFQNKIIQLAIPKNSYPQLGLRYHKDLSAKTLFYILHYYSELTAENPYKTIGLKKELLAFSLSFFSVTILGPLFIKNQSKLEESLRKALNNITGKYQGGSKKLEGLIQHLRCFDLISSKDDSVRISFSHKKDCENILTPKIKLNILALELSTKFNSKFSIEQSNNDTIEYVIASK